MIYTSQLVYSGAKAEWTIGGCESIRKMPEDTVFSSGEEKKIAFIDAYFRHIVHDCRCF